MGAAPFCPAGSGWQGGSQSPSAPLVDAAFTALAREAPPAYPADVLGNASLGNTVLAPAPEAGLAVEMARLWEGDVYTLFGRTNTASLAVEMGRLGEGEDLSVG
jgi:hypothetical protein